MQMTKERKWNETLKVKMLFEKNFSLIICCSKIFSSMISRIKIMSSEMWLFKTWFSKRNKNDKILEDTELASCFRNLLFKKKCKLRTLILNNLDIKQEISFLLFVNTAEMFFFVKKLFFESVSLNLGENRNLNLIWRFLIKIQM